MDQSGHRSYSSQRMPAKLLGSAGADLVSSLEAQLARAHALASVLVAYRDTRDPRDLPEIVRQLDRIRLLNDVTIDALFAAECALHAATNGDTEAAPAGSLNQGSAPPRDR